MTKLNAPTELRSTLATMKSAKEKGVNMNIWDNDIKAVEEAVETIEALRAHPAQGEKISGVDDLKAAVRKMDHPPIHGPSYNEGIDACLSIVYRYPDSLAAGLTWRMRELKAASHPATPAEGARSGDVERLHRTIRFVLDKDEDLSQFTIDELTLALDETGYDSDAPSTSQSPAESEDKRPSEFWAGKASAAFILAEEIKLRKQLTDALKALLEAVKAEPTMQGRHFVGLGIQVTNAISAAERAPRAWECMGRKQALPEPGECNWPDCGCDPHATKVIESLVEQGWTAGRSQPGMVTEFSDAEYVKLANDQLAKCMDEIQACQSEIERLRNLDVMHEAAQKLLAAERNSLLDQVEELKTCLHDFVFKEAVCDQTIEWAKRLVSEGGGK